MWHALTEGNKRHSASETDWKHLSSGQAPSIIVINCDDSRVSTRAIFDAKPGEIFSHENIGAIVQPVHESNRTLRSFLAFPLHHLASVQAVIVLGHRKCGGIEKLTNTLLKGGVRTDGDLEEWLLPVVPNDIAQKIRSLKDTLSATHLTAIMEELVPLLSLRNLFHYTLKDTEFGSLSFKTLVAGGHIHAFAGLYDFTEHGQGRVDIFNMPQQCYIPMCDMPDILKPRPEATPEAAISSPATEGTLQLLNSEKSLPDNSRDIPSMEMIHSYLARAIESKIEGQT